MKLALFDFDGTISHKDSMIDFIQFAVGKRRYFSGLVKQSPMLLSYLLKRTSNSEAKQSMLAHYFSGWPAQHFSKTAKLYAEQSLPNIIRTKALDRILWHQTQGHRVIIVSASIENWLKPWCDYLNIELIASHLAISNDSVTGRLQGLNCHGPEKVRRVEEYLKLTDYQYIYAYGDSSGDKQLLTLADEPHYKAFH
ncbi:MAG: HAD-IB family hydrolase [Proteobacteria bacterium]|nr:MAG: HAD-IB family hydrolase [Pseudomonadota bacterium]